MKYNLAPIVLEYRQDRAEELGHDLGGVVKILEKSGYRIFAINGGVIGDFDVTESYENIVAIRKGSKAEKVICS